MYKQIMDDYFSTIHKIIVTGHWYTEQISKELKEFGITEPQYNVLRILKVADGQPRTVQEIQAGMVQKSSNVTRIVDKLLSKEYVDRKECAENRRKMDITLTEKGAEFLKELDKKVYAFHAPLTEKLNKAELNTLHSLIVKLKE